MNSQSERASNLSAHIAIQPLPATLQSRRFGLHGERAGLARACVLIVAGSAEIGGAEPIALRAPAIAWLPVEAGQYLRVPAGSHGYIGWFSPALTRNALGEWAESAQLRYLIDRTVVASQIDHADSVAELEHAFRSVERELARSERGSWVYLSAQAALVLVHCWRVCGLEDLAQRGGGAAALLLLRFRNLVELHFREQWTVARYAHALRISTDRLHDICVRTLRRTPLELVHERLTHEAGQRLLRSGFTIEQIAADLGFRTTSYFSRFMRRQTGTSPGRLRRESQGARARADAPAAVGFADWP